MSDKKNKLRNLLGLMLVSLVFVGCTTSTGDSNTTASSSSAATNGEQTTFTADEVSQHATSSDCWTIVNDAVYDLTSYVNSHPGGPAKISQICGTDGTSLFENADPHDERATNQLETLYMGELAN